MGIMHARSVARPERDKYTVEPWRCGQYQGAVAAHSLHGFAAVVAALVAVAIASAASPSAASAQTSRDRAQALLRQADAAIGRETMESAREAIRLSRSALAQIAVRGSTPPTRTAADLDRFIASRAFLFTSMGYRILSQTDSQSHYLSRAIPLARAIDDPSGESLALTELGTLLSRTGQADSSTNAFRRALMLAETRLGTREQTQVLIKFGGSMAPTGRLDTARVMLVKGAQLAAADKDAVSFAHAHRLLAGIHDRTGTLDSALAYYRVSQRVFDALKDSASLSTVHAEVAQLFHRLNLLDSALVYSGSAIAIQQSRGMLLPLMRSYRGRGIILSRQRMYDSAIVYQRQALELARRLGSAVDAVGLESELGMQFAAVQPESALVHARVALAGSAPLTSSGRAYATLALAMAHMALGHRDSALAWAQAAVRAPRADLSPELTYQAVGVNAIANYMAERYEVAAAYADSATALEAGVGRATGGDFFRVAFGDRNVKLYRMWTNSWVLLEPKVGARAVFSALAVSERGRAQALLDLMTEGRRDVSAGADLAAEGLQLMNAALRTADVVLSYEIFDDALAIWTLKKGGELRMEVVSVAPDSLARAVGEFRALLGVDRATRSLSLRGDGLERGAAAAASGDWRAAGRRLRRLLLPDSVAALLQKGRQVVIVPAGAVAVVPFAALPDANGDGVLSDAVSIRYAPSLATLAAAEGRPVAASSSSLVIANPTMPAAVSASGTRVQLGPLPGAEAEGADVARRLSSSPFRGATATETLMRLRFPSSRVIHIASHGYAYSSEALARNSFIALAADSRHDGLLTVGELLEDPVLKLSADLVTLSACQTGLGDLRETEGTIGLQRAFLARGARSVLVSLWSVSDESTRLLMDRFYAHWIDDRDKPDKAESLQRAQADVRKKAEFSAPKFWAAFQVVGAR